MKIRLSMCLLVFCCSFMLANAVAAENLDELINNHLIAYPAPSMAVAVLQDGEVVEMKAYGFADNEKRIPADTDTQYRLASVTKQFTAAAIMLLVDDGKLHLDDELSDLLPKMPKAWKGVTLRHLLSHTSGIPNYTGQGQYDEIAKKPQKHKAVLKLVIDLPLQFKPGDRYRYSNTNYFLLGMIIERVTKKTYNEFLQERIFIPLGMTQTRLDDTSAEMPKRAIGYNSMSGISMPIAPPDASVSFSAGGLISSIADMAKWEAALFDGTVVKKELLQQMWTPMKLNDGMSTEYGFGWNVTHIGDHSMVAHSGGIEGFSTMYARCTDCGLSVIMLCNSTPIHQSKMARKIAALYRPEFAMPKPLALQDPEPELGARMKQIVLGFTEGKIDPNIFAEGMRQAMAPEVIAMMRSIFNALGPLNSFQLIGRDYSGSHLVLRYRVVFGTMPLWMLFYLDEERKISGLSVEPE